MTGRVEGQVATDESAAAALAAAWRRWCLIGFVLLAAAAIALQPALSGGSVRWFIVNLAALAAVLALVRRTLRRNRRLPQAELLPDIGAGNHTTIARGVLIAQLPGYLLYGWPAGWLAWLPALTFAAALVADYLDGYLARRADRVTGLGEALDIEFDGLGLMAATALAVHYGHLPLAYFLTVGCARYLYLLVQAAARRMGRQLHPLPPSDTRRALAGVVMELAAAALWPIAQPAMMTLAGAIVAVPFLTGFGRDALVTLGAIDPTSARYLRVRRALARVATTAVPPIARVALVLLLFPALLSAAQAMTGSVSGARAAVAQVAGVILLLFGLACLGSIALGVAGRAGAAGILVVYGIFLSLTGLTESGLAAWGCAFVIFLFGTGPASLWSPERAIYAGRAGARA